MSVLIYASLHSQNSIIFSPASSLQGSGKTSLVNQFADLLNYRVEPIMLYQDMTSRDLLQQRATLANGDTVWRRSALIGAAIDGSLAVLDGVHRINTGTFSVLQRYVR